MLDDVRRFQELDSEHMLEEIDGLPDQLQIAWELGQQPPLPDAVGIRQVVIAGMGGSAIGADLLAAYALPLCPVPVFVHRNYDLPAWANGPETLVIASSHSGNTEETLSAFDAAVQRGCRLMAVCTGGQLAEKAREHGVPLWTFDHKGQPRAAVGYSFGLLLAAFTRLGLIPDPSEELAGAVQAMRDQQAHLRADVPTTQNPAKRMAGQWVGRWVVVLGADHLEPVARRWKGQISEVAKSWGQFEFLPESDHNTLAGLVQPEEQFAHSMVIFLQADSLHPRNQLRVDVTRQIFMVEGLNTDVYRATGGSRLAHMWTALHFGDYSAYYLAMAYGIDPSPVPAIESLKVELKKH